MSKTVWALIEIEDGKAARAVDHIHCHTAR
jgi:hypothetical protein